MKNRIAKIIGYHFFQAKNDDEAIRCGMACAEDIINEIAKED